MSKNAVMPLSDYVSVCDTIREKIPDIVLVEKTIYREQEGSFTETLVAGTLIEGEQYLIKYTDTGLGNIDEGGIYSASLVNVPNVGSALGMAVILKHPVAENATHTIYVYQSGVDIMLYVENAYSAEDGSVSISVIETTGKIVSGELTEKVDEVYEAGQKAEHDKFWDVFQDNGNKIEYSNTLGAFSGYSFTFDNFYPKYDICPTGNAKQLFYAWTEGNVIGSLSQRLKECGVVLDTSKATLLAQMFNYTRFTELPAISFESVTTTATNDIRDVFSNNPYLVTIEKTIVTENTHYKSWFYNTTNLENVVFEGVIGQNGLDFSPCTKLSKASWINIMSHLSPDATGLSITGSLASVKKAFETSEGANDGNTSDAWLTLCGRRDNWTISLV